MKILYVIDKVNIGGATDYLFFLALENMAQNRIQIACKLSVRETKLIPGVVDLQFVDGRSLYDLFDRNNFDLIHWFKAESTSLFDELCDYMNKKNNLLPIVITVCQNPRDFRHKLTPNEIKYSQQIIFIDNHTFNNKLNKYLPAERKKMIYFGTKQTLNNHSESTNNEYIVFGRGSSLNKCHPELIDWYNSINAVNKKFIIVGIGTKAEWLDSEIRKFGLSESVEIIPHLPYNEWLLKVNTFDVFLYQMPLNSYSSIDGTMQVAMLYGKPIVYYGPEPPKELIVHGESGFIANNKQEFIHFATLLANNPDLRLKMGQKAKERILKEFHWDVTIKNYKALYQELISNIPSKSKVYFQYQIYYSIAKMIYFLRSNFANLFPREFRKSIKHKILASLKSV